MKTIILEVDETQKAHLFKPDDMKPMEAINLLTAAAAWYYKEYHGISSINRATEMMGTELIQSVAGRTYRM